jgi:hypothetical protein
VDRDVAVHRVQRELDEETPADVGVGVSGDGGVALASRMSAGKLRGSKSNSLNDDILGAFLEN